MSRNWGGRKSKRFTGLPEHPHVWRPRSDMGRAVYDCACGAWGRRSLSTGDIRADVRPEGLGRDPTVGFKVLDDDVMQAHMEGRSPMRRTHSTRNSRPIQEKLRRDRELPRK